MKLIKSIFITISSLLIILLGSSHIYARSIVAVQLKNEYDANEVAADYKYKHKIIQVTGTIKEISKDFMDFPMLTLVTSSEWSSVVCGFSDEDETQLISLRKGQSVTLYGECRGMTLGSIYLNKCSLQQIKKPSSNNIPEPKNVDIKILQNNLVLLFHGPVFDYYISKLKLTSYTQEYNESGIIEVALILDPIGNNKINMIRELRKDIQSHKIIMDDSCIGVTELLRYIMFVGTFDIDHKIISFNRNLYIDGNGSAIGLKEVNERFSYLGIQYPTMKRVAEALVSLILDYEEYPEHYTANQQPRSR